MGRSYVKPLPVGSGRPGLTGLWSRAENVCAAAYVGCMTLRIDVSRALTTHEERAALVRAVVVAEPEDELDWIEWKIAGDLSKRPTQGTIARHILGMANRLPDRAALHAGGCGYLILGAEPG